MVCWSPRCFVFESRRQLQRLFRRHLGMTPTQYFLKARLTGAFGARFRFQVGIWPLASDGRNVDMCIAVEDYFNQRRADMERSANQMAL
jgi:AraC-like DNA-binding protein